MNDLTKGNVYKLMLQFTWPLMLGNLFQQLYHIIDSLIVGNYLGKEALAAVGAAHPVIFALVSLIIGIGSGLSIVISQFYGAKQYENVKVASDTTYIFILGSSFILTLLGIIYADYIISILELPEEIITYTVSYFKIYLVGLVFMFGFNGTHSILRGLGDSKTPLIFLLVATLINVFLDLLFVAVLGWGINSVAWATVFSQFIAFVLIIRYINAKHPLISIKVFHFKFNYKILIQSLKIGLPSGIQQTLVALGIMALFRIVSEFGTEAVAAYTIVSKLDAIIVLPAINIAASLSMFVGQNFGAGRIDRIYNGFWVSLKLNTIVTILLSVICIVFRRDIISFFNNDSEVIRIGSEYLLIAGGFYLIFGSMYIINAVLRGAGDAFVPMLITLFSLWIVRIPLSYFLSRTLETNGIWWGIPIAWMFGLILSLIFFKIGNWKKKNIVGNYKNTINLGID